MNHKILTGIASALLLVAATAQAGDKGEEIYKTKCAVCHASGAAGAPKVGDKEAWAPRIAQGDEALMQAVMNGKNAMPPKGTCMDCSEEDLKAAMHYMVNNSK